jgi:C4-type Zn-finger protein
MSFSANNIATLDCTRPCPICDQHLELSAIETVPWARRTAGQQLVFRCENCGVAQTEWSSIPLVSAPEIVPEDPTGPIETLEQVSP